jgi:hypothetical protein
MLGWRITLAVAALLLCSHAGPTSAQTDSRVVEDFSRETIGADPTSFSPQAGFWSVAAADNRLVLLEDGSRWQGSDLAIGLATQARALYRERWAEFIDDLAEAAYFPLAEFSRVDGFSGGTLSVRFKVLGGAAEQDCGLAFDIQDNGDFLALKSDTVENNLVLYRSIQGQVTSLQRVPNVETSVGDWHEQQLVVVGTHVTGLVDGQVRLEATLDAPPSGRVGVFAKRDTVVMFADFVVDANATAVAAQVPPAGQGPVTVPTGNLDQAVNWARQSELPKAHGELQEFMDDWDSVQIAVRQRSPGAADAIAAAVADARQVLLNPSGPAPSQAAYVATLERLQRTVREQQSRLG